ncbi:MAG: DEAD/DEAH box helicase [Isosphaeraceae bacterium]
MSLHTKTMTEEQIEKTESETEAGFDQWPLKETTLRALDRVGYKSPSPIQTHLIGAALEGKDCLGNAPTGTGKTASFLVPILERIDERDRDRRPQALVLAPTRELVHQIGMEFDRLSFGRRARAVGVVGGESIYRQQKLISSGCQLVIATPGRLIDLMDRGSVSLERVKLVVLDEADQMLDIGFRPAVERIMGAIPTPRQTLLMSATMPPGVRELARKYLVDPIDVRLIRDDEDATVPAIKQSYLMVHPERKFELLLKLLHRERPQRAIVFCRTKRGADRVGDLLQAEGLRAQAMHGNLSQSQRNRVLHEFRTGRLNTLVATDVVGRGIDVRGVSHVVNFDLPEDPTHYVHRIGRTGRMGSDGAAFSLVLPDQSRLLDQIEKCIARELESDRVEGVPSPDRPANSLHRPPSGPRRQGYAGRGPRPPFRAGGRPKGGFRPRYNQDRREAQGSNRP